MARNEKPNTEGSHEQRDKELFDHIAENYARKDLLPAHSVARKHRLEQTLRGVLQNKKPAMLEVGCGAGFSATYLKGQYEKFHGIDYSEKLIAYARRYNSCLNAEFSPINVRDLPQDWKFDVVFMIGVLHHLEDPVSILSKLRRNLNPGGWLVANEPQRANILFHGMRQIRKKVDPAYSEDQLEYNEVELKDMFKDSGYKDVTVSPQGLLSTPFAEVAMPLQTVTCAISQFACAADAWFEKIGRQLLTKLSWNLVVQGRKDDQ